jgi:ABC-2 type transport system permease protein
MENGRNYFHYKMDQKMLNFIYNSAKYEVKRDKWKNINIEIYYHKATVNLENDFWRKKSLEYYTSNFSPYSTTGSNYGISKNIGSFAQSYANTILFGSDTFIARYIIKMQLIPFAVTSQGSAPN